MTVGTLSAIITNVAAAKENKHGGQQAGYGPVVQLVRTLACHARGRQFEPDPGRHYASVAQSVEQGTENPRVIGSIPIGGTSQGNPAGFPICGRSSSGRAPPCQGGGSEFEPRRPLHYCGSLAQLGEHLPYKQRVSGSSPLTSTMWPGSSVG